MPIADFNDMMPHTLTITEFVSRDKYNAPSYGSPITYTGRVVYEDKLTRNMNPKSPTFDEEVIASGAVWLQTTTLIDYNDKLELPNGDTPDIVSVQVVPDDDGTHHIKLLFRS